MNSNEIINKEKRKISTLRVAIKLQVESILSERAGDVHALESARRAYEEVSRFLKDLQGNPPSDFDRYFEKDLGRYASVPLRRVCSDPALRDVDLVLKDRTTFGIRKGLKASSSSRLVRIHRRGGGNKRKYQISIFIDIDRTQNWSSYNKEFREKIYDKFIQGDNLEHFTHEFTHILDAQRQSDEYFLARNELIAKRKSTRSEDEDAYLNAYVNDTAESNAYIRQTLTRVEQALDAAGSDAEVIEILGNSQREFVEKFMDVYLIKIAKKRFNEDNRLRAVKRAMAFYDRAVERYF